MTSPEFTSLRKGVILLTSARRHQRPVDAALAEPIFLKLLNEAEAVSFDIFDTLTARTVYHPVDVFHFLPSHPAFQALALPAGIDIAAHRIEAERQLGLTEPNGDLREIYTTFCQRLGLDPAQVEALALAEEDVEIDVGIGNDEARPLFRRAVASGKPVVLVSDTFHRPEFLLKLLQHCGYEVAPHQIYSSCHRRASKAESRLFPIVLAELKVAPAKLLHVGDNGHADHVVPSKLGIASIWHPFRAHGDTAPHYPAKEKALQSQIKSLSERAKMPRRHSTGFWHQLGFGVMGPLMCGFSLWLRRRLEEEKADRAYFLLRDGELMHRVYRAVVGEDSPCPSRTLPSSRRGFVFPALGTDAGLALQTMLRSSNRSTLRPAGSYLQRVDLDPSLYEEDFAAVGLGHSGKMVSGFRDQDKITTLFTRPRIVDAVLLRAAEEQSLLFAYLQQEGVLAPGHAALVDLGWLGSNQKALQQMFQAQNIPTRLSGFYFGTRTAPAAERAGLALSSYAFHLGEPRQLEKMILTNCDVLETLCSSATGSLRHFRQHDNQIVPVFDKVNYPEEHVRSIEAVHLGAEEFALNFAQRIRRHGWKAIPLESALENLVRVLTRPTTEEARNLGGLVHEESLGTDLGQPLAGFRPESTAPAELLEDYQATTWKPGLLNLPTEQTARLRTVLWMMQDTHPELRAVLA